ncbi:MAG TPA: hypothetical protein VH599_08410 [Ktedonobacterales bacterium]
MQAVSLGDSAWTATFPHRVTPLYDEWFAGLLLRCDEVNHWPSGTTLTMLRQASSPTKLIQLPNLSVPTQYQIECMAVWLALPVQTVRDTTYLQELTKLYGVLHPVPKDLWPSLTFRICPECLRKNRLLKRTLALPHVWCCPWHEVTLLTRCQCGSPLRLFNQQALPFTCHVCRRDWADLPTVSPTPERIAITRQLLSCYEKFLIWGNPAMVEQAFYAIVQTWANEIKPGWRLPPEWFLWENRPRPSPASSNGVPSLSRLVFNLIKYHLYFDPRVVF